MSNRRVVVAGLRYSPNLGDGLIATRIERSLEYRGVKVATLDISGRDRYGVEIDSNRDKYIAMLHKLPKILGQIAFLFGYFLKLRGRLLAHYKSALTPKTEHVLIGGGQLIADKSLNFPLKVHLLTKLCNQKGISYSFVCVGVSDSFSLLGRILFNRSLRGATKIMVRDRDSADRVKKNFGLESAEIVFDPAIVFVGSKHSKEVKKPINSVAINIISPRIAKYASQGGFEMEEEEYRALVFALIVFLKERGVNVLLHTNGDRMDYSVAEEILNHCVISQLEDVELLARPTTVEEFEEQYDQFDMLVGWRMHALIHAYSCGKPVIGFKWDSKLQSFFEIIGANNLLLPSRATSLSPFSDLWAAMQESNFVALCNVDQTMEGRCFASSVADLLEVSE